MYEFYFIKHGSGSGDRKYDKWVQMEYQLTFNLTP